jgi:hypothetical protein
MYITVEKHYKIVISKKGFFGEAYLINTLLTYYLSWRSKTTSPTLSDSSWRSLSSALISLGVFFCRR